MNKFRTVKAFYFRGVVYLEPFAVVVVVAVVVLRPPTPSNFWVRDVIPLFGAFWLPVDMLVEEPLPNRVPSIGALTSDLLPIEPNVVGATCRLDVFQPPEVAADDGYFDLVAEFVAKMSGLALSTAGFVVVTGVTVVGLAVVVIGFVDSTTDDACGFSDVICGGFGRPPAAAGDGLRARVVNVVRDGGVFVRLNGAVLGVFKALMVMFADAWVVDPCIGWAFFTIAGFSNDFCLKLLNAPTAPSTDFWLLDADAAAGFAVAVLFTGATRATGAAATAAAGILDALAVINGIAAVSVVGRLPFRFCDAE